jgi:hypothetical protein
MMNWQPITEFKNANGDYLLWLNEDTGFWIEAIFRKGNWYSSDYSRLLTRNELNIITHFLIITEPTKP